MFWRLFGISLSIPFVILGAISRFLALLCQSLAASPRVSEHLEPEPDTYCLITGASRGLGREFALEFARRGWNLILISRTETREFSQYLKQQHKVECVSIACDLSKPNATQISLEKLGSFKSKIRVLVANAGIAYSADFFDTPSRKIIEMLHLNITNHTTLIHKIFQPFTSTRETSRILIVSSVGAHSVPAHQAVYFATKAYLSTLASGINHETSDSNISVLLLEPGPIEDTGFREAACCRDSFAFKIPGQSKAREIAAQAADRLLGLNPSGVCRPGLLDRLTVFMAPFLSFQIKGEICRLYMENPKA